MKSTTRLAQNSTSESNINSLYTPTGADLGAVRKYNRLLILDYLRKNEPTSKATIAQKLKISRSTVGIIIEELKEEGLVSEGGKQSAADKGGRRGTRVYFNAKHGYIIGVDIGRSHLKLSLTDLAGDVIDDNSTGFNMEKIGGENGLEVVAEKIKGLMEKHGIEAEKLRGIGIGLPGVIKQAAGEIISPPLLKNWFGIDIPGALRKKLKLRNIVIYVDNDANMGALGESRYGKGRNISNLVYVKIGTGIGSGIIRNGQPAGLTGEIGHVIVDSERADGELCGSCGKKGCLESRAGARAIIRAASEGNPHLFHAENDSYSSSLREIDLVIKAAKDGNRACRDALKTAGQLVGQVLGSFVMNYENPSLIILDGKTIRTSEQQQETTFLENIRGSATGSTLSITLARIELGELGDRAIALGAVAKVIENDPEFSPFINNSPLPAIV